jgi:biotin operon repressor
MKLTPVMEKYVLHWGEMGTRWGVNRSIAQIHALLYLSPQPLTAEEIADTLSIARSNVSTSLKELQGFGLVRMTHLLGDRGRSIPRSRSCASAWPKPKPTRAPIPRSRPASSACSPSSIR